MENPRYDININYVPLRISGQQNVLIGGVTQSIPSYSGPYYFAQMPVAGISATGSDYRAALNNLLVIATASTTPDPNILPFKPTW